MIEYPDLDKEYQCPDCEGICAGWELLQPTMDGPMYVCPNCGCVQEAKYVNAHLA